MQALVRAIRRGSLVLGFLFATLSGRVATAVTFSDDTFAPGDWTATVLYPSNVTNSYSQELAGGNPGAYRRMIHTLPGGSSFAVYHEYTAASFDPSTMPPGSALAVEYHEDHIRLDGATLIFHAALRQDGIVYVAGVPQSESGFGVWNSFDPGLYGPSEFEQWDPGPVAHPDFSPSGSPIHFGYVRKGNWNSAIVYDLGVDNWSVTVSSVPVGTVLREKKISDGTGTLLDNIDRFGECVSYLGDVDGNGIGDLATSTLDDDEGTDAGATWILKMDRDAFLGDFMSAFVKIRDGSGGFYPLSQTDGDRFGQCGDGIGDLNHDGIPDLAVGSEQLAEGVVYILFLSPSGTVKASRRIASGAWGFPTGELATGDNFGRDIARIGDLDGDGNVDIAVGAQTHVEGGVKRGGVFILFLEPDGYVRDWARISHSTVPSLGLENDDRFGLGVTGPGDIDGDGVPDLAVGAFFDDDAGTDAGAVYILFLNTDGTVKAHEKLGDAAVGGGLDAGDRFGIGLTAPGDLDGDGVPDVIVGASRDDDGGTDYGAVYVILLNSDGTAKGFQKISATQGGFTGPLNTGDEWGMDLEAWVGAGGQRKLAVGARQDDDGGLNRGAVYILDIAAGLGGPVCGDFLREGGEACDDGNTDPGDGCNATCETEQALFLSGTASGGSVTATVDGNPVVASTTSGQSAEAVLADLAAAINADGTLFALGRTAVARAQALFVDGTSSLASGDAGLTAGARDDLDLVRRRLDLTFWARQLSPTDKRSARFSLEPEPQTPVDVVALSNGVIDLSVPGPFPGSGGIDFGSGDYLSFDIGGVALGSCASTTPTFGGQLVNTSYPNPRFMQASLRGSPGVAGLRCGQTGVFFGQHLIAPPSGFGSPAPFGIPASTAHSPTSYITYIKFAAMPWTNRSAGGVFVDASQPSNLSVRSQGLSARTPGGEGALNLVTPTAVLRVDEVFAPYAKSSVAFTRLRLRFVPEPSQAPMLVMGAAFLAALARLRWRRSRG